MKAKRKTRKRTAPRKPRKPCGPILSTTRLLDALRRRDLMRRLLVVCQARVQHIHSLGHTYAAIGRHAGLGKQRMREISKGVYMSEGMLVALLNAKIVKAEDLFVSGLDELQVKVLEVLVEEHGFRPPASCGR